ncbi:EthD family reductase [Chachezhania sediminis]|uniref:EthD family reductase n=1 Tax=Chachezhania sediminis TaxID=2599291 RepID=UPI00131BBDAA|nr:EthD family reductase [Chachezhania sediminis]
MSASMQVIYPATEGTTFDFDYYMDTHMKLVADSFGPHLDQTLVTRGLAGGPGVPPGYHAIATMVFKDQAAMNEALKDSADAVKDIPNFYNGKAQMLFGEVAG